MISKYLFFIVGEDPARVSKLHQSTIKRTKTFAIAIHIPVILWACTGLLIALEIFELDILPAILIAGFCSLMIYLVERLVLATPKGWFVNIGRIFIGGIVALLGASAVDLIIFDREVTQQLRETGTARIQSEYEKTFSIQQQAVIQRKSDWLKGQEAANCEANGTCGSKTRSVGPVYRELSKHATLLRAEYMTAQNQLDQLGVQKDLALLEWRTTSQAEDQAGLLARVEALHQYTKKNTFALIGWILFFLLVFILELMVILTKLLSTQTVDDELDRIREDISLHKARAYKEAVSSPLANAKNLLEANYR